MQKKQGLMILACLVLALLGLTGLKTQDVRAATYYVANQGNDANNGLTPDSPWQTLAKVNAFAFQPGDTILLAGGGLWRERLLPAASGTPDHPITFSSYGSGPRPILEGTDIAAGWRNYQGRLWYKSGYNYEVNLVLFDALLGTQESALSYLNADREWFWQPADSTLYLYCSGDPNQMYQSPGIEVGSSRQDNLKIYDTSEQSGYLAFENLHLRHANDSGIEMQGCRYITINNCLVDTSGRINIYLYDVQYFQMLNSESFGCLEQHGIYLSSGQEIKPGGDISAHITLEASAFHHNKANGIQVNPNDGPGLEDLTITRCHIYLNGGHGILDMGTRGGYFNYNLLYDNARAQLFCHYNEVTHKNGDVAARYVQIYNNVIGAINVASVYGLYISKYSDHCVAKNNIFYWQKGTREVVKIEQPRPNAGLDYNCYYVPNPAGMFQWGTKWYSSFAAWKKASKQDGHSLNTDPYFIDAHAYNLALAAASPCINAGTSVGLTRDYEGHPVPYGAAVDLGAYEWR